MSEKWFVKENIHDSNRASQEWVNECLQIGCEHAHMTSKGAVCETFSPSEVRARFESHFECEDACVNKMNGKVIWIGQQTVFERDI